MRALERTVPAPADLGLELIRVPEGSPLTLAVTMQSVSEGVLVSATVTGDLVGECGRCLRDLTDHLDVSFQQLYAYEGNAMFEAVPGHEDESPEEDEVGRMQGDLIDLEPELRDAVVLALPVNPICRPDCPGLCPECGEPWDELPADHNHEQADPRWAALNQLKEP